MKWKVNGVWLGCAMALVLCSCTKQQAQLQIQVDNALELTLTDGQFLLSADLLAEHKLRLSDTAVFADGQRIPSQIIDTDADGQKDALLVVTDFAAAQRRTFTLSNAGPAPAISPRVQVDFSRRVGGTKPGDQYQGGSYQAITEAVLEPDHLPGDRLYRYEGPGWESEDIAYRLYFDARNMIDIFGKKQTGLVLQQVGQDDANYHQLSDWGMDVLKVGQSLGLGAVAVWAENAVQGMAQAHTMHVRLTEHGPLQAQLRVQRSGLKSAEHSVQLTTTLSIRAGSRLTKSQVRADAPVSLATGIVKHAGTKLLLSGETAGQWRYMASWGQQSEAGDGLGMAIFYPADSKHRVSEDPTNYLLIFDTDSGRADYYFAAVWQQDPAGIKTEQEFQQYLQQTLAVLNQPLVVHILP